MAVVLIDGFDHYTADKIGRMWDATSGTLAMETASPRTGTQSLKMALNGILTFNVWKDEHASTAVGTTKAGVGLAVKLPGDPSSTPVDIVTASWTNPATQDYKLKVNNVGDLRLYLDTTLKFTYNTHDDGTSFDLTDGSWHYIEVTFTNTTVTTTPQFTIHLNNKLVANVTSGTEAAAGNAKVAVTVEGTINDQLIDDVFIFNNGSADFQGGAVVNTLMPNGPTIISEWTPSDGAAAHFQMVDEAATTFPDDDTTSVEAVKGFNFQDIYAVADPPATAQPDWGALQVTACLKNLVSGTSATVKGLAYDGNLVTTMDVPQHPAGTFTYDVLSDTTYTYVRWMGTSGMNHSLAELANLGFGLESV